MATTGKGMGFPELMRNIESVVKPPLFLVAFSIDGVPEHFFLVDDMADAAKLASDPESKKLFAEVFTDSDPRFVAASLHIVEQSQDPHLPKGMHTVKGWETWTLNLEGKPDNVRRLPTAKQTQAAQAKVEAEAEAAAKAKKTAANRKAGARRAAATKKKNGNGGGPRKNGNGAPKPPARRKRTTARKTTRNRR